MEKKEGNTICKKCGTNNVEMAKFCGNCGAWLSHQGNIENQIQQPSEQAEESPGEQTEESSKEQAEEQATTSSEEQSQEQTPEQAPDPPSADASEQTPEQKPLDKKKLGIIGAVAAVLILVIVGIASLSGSGVEGRMRNQLRGLDSTSYSDIAEWVENDFVEYFDDYFDLLIVAIDESDNYLDDRFLDAQERFIEWNFTIDTQRDTLLIELIYEELDLAELLVSELEGLDSNSLSDILDWIDRVESEHGRQIHLWTTATCVDGGWLSTDVATEENEELFVEWTYDYHDDPFLLSIDIELVFNTVRTFYFGDTFEFSGLEAVFEGDIVWGIDTNEWSSTHGAEYFKVPLTLTNVSNTTNNRFSPRIYNPDGTQMDWFSITGAEDDITRMGGLRPDATQTGYIYIKFDEDGDYAIELRDSPFTIEIIIPIDSAELRGQPEPLNLRPDTTLEAIAEETEILAQIFEENFDGMMTIEVDAYGENELIFTYVYFEVVPPGRTHIVNEFMEEIVEGMFVIYGITAYRVMIELGLENAVITTVFVDNAGIEHFRESVEFPLS